MTTVAEALEAAAKIADDRTEQWRLTRTWMEDPAQNRRLPYQQIDREVLESRENEARVIAGLIRELAKPPSPE